MIKRYFVKSFWFTCGLLLKTRHRYNYTGLQNISKDKAVLLVGNHVSWIDWFALQLPIDRQINFLIDRLEERRVGKVCITRLTPLNYNKTSKMKKQNKLNTKEN
mgnify:CR=1 FL=1